MQRLTQLRESLRREYGVGRTLHEQLADAVAAEEYELAARIRDELARAWRSVTLRVHVRVTRARLRRRPAPRTRVCAAMSILT